MVRYVIRRAILEDIPAIRAIARENWWTTELNFPEKQSIQHMLDTIYSSENLAKQIKHGTQFYMLLQEPARSVAFLSWTSKGQTATIHQVYCLPSTQGKGYMKILINEISVILEVEGKKFINIEISNDDTQVDYFEKLGFHLKVARSNNEQIASNKKLLLTRSLT